MKIPYEELESRLVKSLSEGNILAFNTIFRMYSGRLYRFAYGYLKNRDEAEELVQEAFTIIWGKRAKLKKELSFRSYLFTISFNIIKKHFRSRACFTEYLSSNIGDDLDMRTSQNITYESLVRYIKELSDLLPERRREIFIKSRFEGLSIEEISAELKISHKTVENQLTDALKFIRANLKNYSQTIVLSLILINI